MQIKKDEVKEKILKAAKSEFLNKGFEKASLRQIAASVDVTKGNLYTYFKNKDELYSVLVEPAMKCLKDSLVVSNDDYIKSYGLKSSAVSVEHFNLFVDSLSGLTDELKLLFFCSAGSSYAVFRENIYALYFDSTNQFFLKWNQFNPGKNVKVSEMLIHSFAALYLSFIEEILVHEPNREEQSIYVEQMAKFVYNGIIGVIGTK